MQVGLTNILNPKPALTTGNFVVQIGSDISANASNLAPVTLTEAAFTSCQINFNPAFVNTTGNMEI